MDGGKEGRKKEEKKQIFMLKRAENIKSDQRSGKEFSQHILI